MFSYNKKALLITSHIWNSKRKAGFHWIADALWRMGWEVYFVTAVSQIDKIKGDYRFQYLSSLELNTVITEKEHFYSYIWFRWWRPMDLRHPWMNKITAPLFRTYGRQVIDNHLKEIIKTADLVIFESIPNVAFFPTFKKINPNARYVYRVSDNLHLSNIHPAVLEIEERIAPDFDLISVPTQNIFDKFAPLTNVKLQRHGIPKHLYDRKHNNPYAPNTINAIFVGSLSFDYDFLSKASKLFPEIDFHIIGPLPNLPKRNNIHTYGEMPYEETIPFVKYATIGLSPMTRPSLGDSNKILQFTYCKLPIVISSINRSNWPHFFYYDIGSEKSIVNAIQGALSFDKNIIPKEMVNSWEQLVQSLLETPLNEA